MAATTWVGLSITGAIGAAGALRDTWPAFFNWPPVDFHALFGTLLCAVIIRRFHRDKHVPWSRDDLLALRLGLSRAVYILLYGIFGLELLMRIAAHPAGAALTPPEGLRIYLAYGSVALLVIRASAALSARRPPARQMSPQLAQAEGGAVPP